MARKKAQEIFKPVQDGQKLVYTADLISTASDDAVRRNRSATTERTDKFIHIENGIYPFTRSGNGSYGNESMLTVKDIVVLCQKAYYNFQTFRNVLELMVEFSNNKVYFKGGSSKSRQFFTALFDKVNLWNLGDQFFRECYRSGNVFIYRKDSIAEPSDIRKLTQTFGLQAKASFRLPFKYEILNPADIALMSGSTFMTGNYMKVLTPYELSSLKTPRFESDVELFNSLPPKIQEQIKKGNSPVWIPLDESKTYCIFYKKQDYEPFAVPMGYGVLADINWKEELKRIDMAIARTTQHAVLLITNGEPVKDGGMGVNYKFLDELEKIFKNESVGRVLIADYTTKAEFVIPQIGDILDPKKYEIVENDIQMGLHNILLGSDEKFASQHIKVKIFMEKLRQSRQVFLQNFLIPEIKRIADEIGLKNYPTPYFQDYDLKDDVEYSKIYSRLYESGVLTPQEAINAIQTGILPDKEESVANWQELKSQRDKQMYMPITSVTDPNAAKGLGTPAGRPSGSKAPKKTKVGPVGGSYSAAALREVTVKAHELQTLVEKEFCAKFKIKSLDEKQTSLAHEVACLIIANETPDKWDKSIAKYIKNPKDSDNDQIHEINELAAEHGLEINTAAILFHASK